MIRRTAPAKLLALTVALAAHAALAVALVSGEPTAIAGGTGSAEVRLGNAFVDMAAGTLSAVSADRTAALTPEPPDRLTAEQVMPTPPETATVTAGQAPSEVIQPAEVQPAQALQTAPLPEPVQAETGSVAVAGSQRPMPRSAAFEAAHSAPQAPEPEPRQTAEPARSPSPPQGNAERTAQAGDAAGQREATAQQSGTDGDQQAAGNAAASNYPGLVMRRLSRAGKLGLNARGTAVVAFSIAADGGLSSVSLVSSSGSDALDRAAMAVVSRAAPFPAPPAGAQSSFRIAIE